MLALVPLLGSLLERAVATGAHALAIAPSATAPHPAEEDQAEQEEEAEQDEQEPQDAEAGEERVETVAVVVRPAATLRGSRQVRVHPFRPADVVGDGAHDYEHDHRDQCSDQTESASHRDSTPCV